MPARKKPSKEPAHENRAAWRLTRLAREAAKLDPKAEQAMAEEAVARDLEEWPEY